MQVKKFEAPTMKEALELVKDQLGPEAIILSAQETGGFGRMGRGGVQVTAAVSAAQLKKKEFAERNLRPVDRERLKGSRAAQQKTFIDKSVKRFIPPNVSDRFGEMRYVDIYDDETEAPQNTKSAPTAAVKRSDSGTYSANQAKARVKDAVQSAVHAATSTNVIPPKAKPVTAKPATVTQVNEASMAQQTINTSNAHSIAQTDGQVNALKAEVQALKAILQDFSVNQNGTKGLSLHPGAERGIPYELSQSFETLVSAGIDAELATEILGKAKAELGEARAQKRPLVQAWVAKYLLNDIQISTLSGNEKFHLFVGAPGQGKSSTLVKFAADLVLKKRKRVAIVSCDGDRRVGGDALGVFAKILNCSHFSVSRAEDWISVLKNIESFDFVLVEMPSASLKDKSELENLKSLYPPIRGNTATHFVQALTWRDKDIFETLKRYLNLAITDIVYTRADEASSHGVIYNVFKRFGLTAFAFGMGSRIPDDFEYASKERILDLILKITGNVGFEGGK